MILRCACLVLTGCGGLALTSGPDAGDSGPFGRGGDAGSGDAFVNPTCPDAGAPIQEVTCSVFDMSSCPLGQSCYPLVSPPQGPCEPETYGAFCLHTGEGAQGQPCSSMQECAAGFVCLITGATTECARMCDIGASSMHACPEGFECQPIDIPGFAACL